MLQQVIVLLYITLTIVISFWSKKKSKSSRSFDGANLGVLLCVVAGAGEWLGGTSTTGVSEYGYTYGISGAWYTLANSLGICFLAIFFARLFRSLKTSTVSGIIGNYIGSRAKKVSAVLLIFIMLAVGCSQMVALGSLGEALFGFPHTTSIIIMGCGVLVYTVLGGMMAVSYTNIMHLIVMFSGAVLAIVICGKEIGGFQELRNALPSSYFSIISIGPSKVVSWVIASVLGACTAQAGLQPILASKDEKTAVRSSFWIAVIVAPFGILMALLGMIARVKFPELENAKLALPTLLLSLPTFSGGFVVASILAAILSTASPIFLACGTLFTRDIFQESSLRLESDKKVLALSRLSTGVAGALCMICAILLKNTSMILDMVYFAYSLRGSLFVVLLMGIFWKKTSQNGAIAAMIATAVSGIFWVAYKGVFGVYPIHPAFTETYIAIAVALLATVLCSLIDRKKHQI